MHWKYWDSLICPSGIFSKGEEKRMKSIQLLKGALLVSRICNDATEVDSSNKLTTYNLSTQ
jgi:hypothetical protein